MPTYLEMTRIDWHADELPPDAVAIAAAADRECHGDDHTLETFQAAFERAVRSEPRLVADALVDDGYNHFVLLQARDGRVHVQLIDERPVSGPVPESMPYDELIEVTLARDVDGIAALAEAIAADVELDDDVLVLPQTYDTEDQLRSLVARIAEAIDDGGGACIAEVDRTRYLVTIEPGQGRVERLAFVQEPALVARLWAGDFQPLPRPRR